MLKLLCGAPSSGKSTYITELIGEVSEEKKQIFVIVPEQDNVRSERELLSHFGNGINRYLEVLNFTRLANRVFRVTGGITYDYMDAAGKDLSVAMLLDDYKSDTSAYSKIDGDIDAIKSLRAFLDTLRQRGITPSLIDSTREKVEHNGRAEELAIKLHDTSCILDDYSNLLKNGKDSIDDLTRLVDALRDYDFFDGSYVFIDGFYDYTEPEYRVIKEIIRGAESTVISFPYENGNTSDTYKLPKKAFDRIREIAESLDIEYEIVDTFLYENCNHNEVLKYVKDSVIFGGCENPLEKSQDTVKIVSCKSKYEECVYVARNIVKLVSEGVKFSDISVCASNLDSYTSMLQSVFDKYGIKYMSCDKEVLSDHSFVRFILDSLRAINGGYYVNDMRNLIKNEYSPLSDEEKYTLDNYAALWNLSGKIWKSENDFVRNPRGYVERTEERDITELKLVNTARKKLMKPLLNLASELSKKNGGEMVKAVWNYIEGCNVSKRVKEYSDLLAKDNITKASNENTAWNMLISSLDLLYEKLKGKTLSRDKFIRFVSIIFSDCEMGSIPTETNEVEIGEVGFLRNKGISHLFFMGFADGAFPGAPEHLMMFTESEVEMLLRNYDLKLAEPDDDRADSELFKLLVCACMPKNGLTFTYSTESGKGSISAFAGLIEEPINVKETEFSMFDEMPICKEEVVDYICANYDEFENIEIPESIISKDELRSILSVLDRNRFIISDNLIKNKEIRFSQSKIEKYTDCPFSYFSDYILKLRARNKASFSAAENGSYVHKILEDVLCRIKEQKLSVVDVDREKIREIATNSAAEYIKKISPDTEETSIRFIEVTKRVCSFVLTIIDNIKEEFENSDFIPCDFEKDITKTGLSDSYSIVTSDGTTIKFNGVIDRIDSYEKDGIKYIRIVDYKTGYKNLTLDDVVNGFNLQMLIYLAIVVNAESGSNKAGVMYMPASVPDIEVQSEDSEKIKSEIKDKIKRKGLFIYDEKILRAMDRNLDGKFIPIKLKNDGDFDKYSMAKLVTAEQFGYLERFINKLISDITVNIEKGNIEPNPIRDGKKDACAWCDFLPICRYEGTGRKKKHIEKDMIWDFIKNNGLNNT